jgi:hypothetical protein
VQRVKTEMAALPVTVGVCATDDLLQEVTGSLSHAGPDNG